LRQSEASFLDLDAALTTRGAVRTSAGPIAIQRGRDMPATLTYPGVYIEEIPSGVQTITGVATSIAAFIGWAPQGPVNQATLVESWSEFQTLFGGWIANIPLGYAVNQFFGGGGQQAYIVRLAWTDAATASSTSDPIGGSLTLYATSPGAWGNNLQVTATLQKSNLSRFSLQVVDLSSGKVLETFSNLSLQSTDPQYVVGVINGDSQYLTFVPPGTQTSTPPSASSIPAPTQSAATTQTTGGTLPAGHYFYKVSALYGNSESLVSNEESATTTGTTSSNSISWTAAAPFAGQSPTGYKIYRGTAAGAENVYFTTGNVSTFTDTGAATTSGSPTPSAVLQLIPAPTQSGATTQTTGGTLPAATQYFYQVSALYGNWESAPSNEESITTGAGTTSSNTISWSAAANFNGQNPTGYKIYRGTAAGAENVYFTPSGTTTKFTDIGAVSSPGSPTPSTGVQLSGGQTGTVLNPGDGNFENALLNDPNGNGLPLLNRVPIFNLLCVPGETDAAAIQSLQLYCHNARAFYIVDCPQNVTTGFLIANGPSGTTSNSLNANSNITGQYSINSGYYYPWVLAPDPLAGNRPNLFPPCGFVAGVYAATDAARGVWKAPAGIDASLTGISGLQYVLTDAENGNLNIQGINCLRQFRVYGDVVWGARTLQGNDQFASEWKYVPIRRLALYLESSLYDGTQWVVFEPNDEPLWSQIRLNVGSFMQGLFLQGAFQGSTPQQAYFVKCDSENNPQSSIDQGIVNILVGFAPLYPAEFVVIQIQQMAGQAQS
jgi:hypothetical protein